MSETHTNRIFQPLQFGRFKLNNRIVMAPMTRNKSPKGVPGANVAEYYRSRAAGGVGLIITEGTYIGHLAANGYADVPAFHGEQALAGWKKVVEAVHAAGGRIIPQIWHVGAARNPGVEPDPAVPGYGPMQVESEGKILVKAMTKADIADAINAYAEAAANAEKIGFDGVEIHGAHGYLIDQFLWQGSNQRSDEYGGTLENRCRFALTFRSYSGSRSGSSVITMPESPILRTNWRRYSSRLPTPVLISFTPVPEGCGSRHLKVQTIHWRLGPGK